jgi:hypothetical protein
MGVILVTLNSVRIGHGSQLWQPAVISVGGASDKRENENPGVEWPADVRQAISGTVTKEVAKIGTRQRVFPATMPDGNSA